jgi:Tol biopolymer transport system component
MSRKLIDLHLLFAIGVLNLIFSNYGLAADFTWQLKAPMQQSRSHCASVALNGKVYAIGSYVGGHGGTASVEEYDPATDTWTSKAPISNAVWGLRAGVANGKIYVFGGANNPGGNSTHFSTVEEYDPSTNTWTLKSPMSEAKYNMAIGVFNDKIYIIAGSRGDIAFETTEQYDPLTDTWTTKTPMPVARHLAYFAATSNKIYLFGDPIYVYDMATDSWSTRPAPPFDNVGAPAAAALNGKIYVFGGSFSWGGTGPIGIPDVYEYDPSTDTWSPKTPMATGVALLWQAASVVGNKVYVLGGQTVYPVCSTTFVQEGTLSPKPAEGWIVFASNQDGDDDIWAVSPDATGLRQLTNLPGGECSLPQWSPDSTKIVYGRSHGVVQIWVYDWFAGTNAKIYDAHDYEGQDLGSYDLWRPVWSPDGSKILYTEEFSYNDPHIMVINADGTGRAIVPVQSGFVTIPSWCPSGTAFVYNRRSGASYSEDLWIYDFTATGDIMNGVNHRLTDGADSESTIKYYADWTPSGDIVFVWGHNLAIIDPGQSPNWNGPVSNPVDPHVTFLTNDASLPSPRYLWPSWSSDLSQIVYGYYTGISWDLWIMDASGGNRHPLIATSYSEASPDWGNPRPGIPTEPPVADAGENQVVYADADFTADVTLDGSESDDPDGDELSYLWTWTIGGETHQATGVNPQIELPVGEYTVTLVVNDGQEDSEPDQVVITVIAPMKADLWVLPPVINRYSSIPHIMGIVRLPRIWKDQVDAEKMLVLYPGGIEATSQRVSECGRGGTHATMILARFDKSALMDAARDNGSVELTGVGRLKTGQYFYGTDTIRIIAPGKPR